MPDESQTAKHPPCPGKVPHRSRVEAMRVAAKAIRKARAIRIYWCDDCHAFHITSKVSR
jgi:uncharacterized protein YlaI